MPIKGIGTDIIEIDRIAASTSDKFLRKYFSEKEQEMFSGRRQIYRSIAANFAAKEAFVKAIGTGFEGVLPRDIETLRDENGKPYINIFGTAKRMADMQGIEKIHVSLTHSKEYAVAFVTLE